MTFYETLVQVMDERGMRASELCERAGLHPSYLSKMKSGHMKDPTWEKAVAIISALDMTPDEFYAVQRGQAEV